TRIEKDVVYVDVGTKQTGVLNRDQITADQSADLSAMFTVGQELMLFVIRVSDTEGTVTLSKTRVDRDKNWYDLVAMKDAGGIVEGPVVEANRGGVVIEFMGNRVFVPTSRTGLPREADLTVLVGTVQRARIIDIDEQRKRAVASIRSVAIEERRAEEEAIWSRLEVGQRFTGVVKNLTTYGAFVDIGGIDGMVHNSELSWKHIRHPKEVVAVGQEIEVYIKELDVEKRRISLGYKCEENDPWRQFTAKYNVGDVVEAKIVSMMPFGAFAEVMDGVDGLIHISRISTEKIARPQDVLTIGQMVTVTIVEIDDERRRLSLSIRALLDDARRAEEKAQRDAERAERDAARAAERAEEDALRADMAPYIVRVED
ncbi:MAG: S1 RNA-binding domain-containing protein, partial [Clostridia bacterium]|nr:S1 RNA-binding domain-containing protein [Clostridia bacterium]